MAEQEAFLVEHMTTKTDQPRGFSRPVHPYLELPDGSWILTEGILWRIADEIAHVVTFDQGHFKPGRWKFPTAMVTWLAEQGVLKRDTNGVYLDEEAIKQLAAKAMPELNSKKK